MRKAFSLMTAIFVMLLMAAVGIYIMNLAGKMVKGTGAQYLREQSVLLAKSYTEYAVMAVTANEHNTSNCLDDINGTVDNFYTINVKLSYIGNDDNLGVGSSSGCDRILASDVNETESPLSIIVDVFVSHPPLDHPDGDTAPDITYHKRSLQKI